MFIILSYLNFFILNPYINYLVFFLENSYFFIEYKDIIKILYILVYNLPIKKRDKFSIITGVFIIFLNKYLQTELLFFIKNLNKKIKILLKIELSLFII